MTHVYRCHPHVSANVDGPIVKHQLLHLQQSDIDGACGMHCALMGLMVLGIVKRSDVENLPKAKGKPLSKFWRRSSKHYFDGSSPRELKLILQSYQEQVTCVVARKRAITETLRSLQVNGVSIIGIRNRFFNHWVLAIGTAGNGASASHDKLLILDPSLPPNTLMAWNATLTVKASRQVSHFYETKLGTTLVLVDHALAMTPTLSEIDFSLK